MRSLFLSVAALMLVAGPLAADEPAPAKRLVTKVYSVADLVTPIPGVEAPNGHLGYAPAKKTVAENAEQLLKLVTSMVRPYSWTGVGGPGTAEFFDVGCTLVVNNTADVVQEVGDLLKALHRLQERSVVTEVRVVKVPAGFCEKIGLKRDGAAELTDRELSAILEAVQAYREANVTQFPKVTSFDGQTATVRCAEKRDFVTGVDAVNVKGNTVLVPKNTSVDLGDTLTLCGRVSADEKFVKLEAKLTRTSLVGEADLVPVTTFITPVFEGGSSGKPVPFTQYIQAPNLKTEKVEKSVVVPTGGTVVLGGWTEPAPPPGPLAQGKIPYLPRPVKNARPAEYDVVVLATVRAVREGQPEVAPMPREVRADEKVTAYQLKHVAAADAAQAVSKFIDGKNLKAKVTFDLANNCVFFTGERAARLEIVRLLATMDEQPPQVMIQALVMEVPAGFLADIGMTDDKPGASVLTLTPREVSMFNAQIREAKSRGCLDILARPQLCVVDNQTGFVQVGQQIAYKTSGDAAAQAIEYQHVGLSLRVTPRINPEGKVLLRVQGSYSAVCPNPVNLGNGLKAPVFNEQTVEAKVLTSDAQTVIVRGLSFAHVSRDAADGPFTALAKKLAGGQKRELLIVLTPHCVRK